MNDSIKPQPLSPNQRAIRRFKADWVSMVCGVFLTAVIGIILLYPVFSPPDDSKDKGKSFFRGILAEAKWIPVAFRYAPNQNSDDQFQPPSAKHWLGTDVHGRDQLTRIIYGGRVSLLVGAVGTVVSLVIGVLWGAIAGYVGGRMDGAMMRAVDILYALPSIVFVIVLVTTLEEGVKTRVGHWFKGDIDQTVRLYFLFIGIGAVSWLTMARIVRGQVLSLRSRQFVDASRALGASHARLLRRHILPNVYGIIIVYLTLTVPAVILYESFLSYLGLGIQPPMASWGSLIAEGANQLNPIRIYWWLIVFPAAIMISTLLALNFLGDGLRDALDPRSEK